jgi:hypothetical protein
MTTLTPLLLQEIPDLTARRSPIPAEVQHSARRRVVERALLAR